MLCSSETYINRNDEKNMKKKKNGIKCYVLEVASRKRAKGASLT